MTRAVTLFSSFAVVLATAAFVYADEPEVEMFETTSGYSVPFEGNAEASVLNSICGKDVDLNDFCFPNSLCNLSLQCTTNADCAAGFSCLLDSCCGYNMCVEEAGFCSGGGYCGYYQPCIDCQEVADQNQPLAPNFMASFTQGDLAQSFQQRLPNLTSAEILLNSGTGTQDTVTISIYDGLPNAGGSLLTAGGTIAREGEWARVRFPRIPVAQNQTYYMVLESGGSGGLGIAGSTVNPYLFGHVFANPGYQPFPNFDYTFRTFAEQPIFFDGFETGLIPWGPSPPNRTCSAVFDDAYAALGQASNPDTFYGPYGVNFDNTNGFGVIGGEGNGDPGNWDVEGTYGSAAWGIWIGTHSITFASAVTNVSLDMLRGHSDYSITVQAYFGGGLVATQIVDLVGPHVSEPVTFAGPIDEIVLGSTGVGGAGVDNLVYTGLTNCP